MSFRIIWVASGEPKNEPNSYNLFGMSQLSRLFGLQVTITYALPGVPNVHNVVACGPGPGGLQPHSSDPSFEG